MTKKSIFSFLLIFLIVTNVKAQENWDVTIRNNYSDADEIGFTAYTTITKFTSPIVRQLWENNSYKVKTYDDQDDGLYIFNDTEAALNKSEWKVINPGYGSAVKCTTAQYNFQATTTLFTSDNPIIEAQLRRYNTATFENDFSGTSSGGDMIIQSISYSLPQSPFPVVQGNQITAMAYNIQTIDGIEYTFNEWSDGSTSLLKTFTVPLTEPLNTTYTVEYTGKPAFDSQESGLSFNSYSSKPGADNRVKLSWNEHSNTAVTKYGIWRKGKDGSGNDFNDGKIAEVNRGTTTYTDGDYLLTDGWTDATLQYAVTAYYSTEGTWSDLDYKTTYAEENAATKRMGNGETALNVIKEYSISNYPNPYNPTTNIYYQLPVTGHVTIKVYDMLGREVTELVNSVKAPGRYDVQFDAGNLSSGTYIYQIIVHALNEGGRGYSASKKMLLIK
jgi:hypothetical protein